MRRATVLALLLAVCGAHACTTVLAGKRATADGSTLLLHTDDCGECDFRLARVHPAAADAAAPVLRFKSTYPREVSARAATYAPDYLDAKLPAGLPPSTVPPKPRIIGKNTFDRIVAPPPSPSKIPAPPGSPKAAAPAGARAGSQLLGKFVVPGTEKAKLPAWLKVHGAAANESDGLRGSFTADLSLWFMLACSFAAVCGVVSHRDVIHSHAVIILWVILHHMTRAATAWRGTGYLHTLFTPSAALLPLEYCLNLTDQEMVGDDGLDDLAEWREFIERETGVKLTIVV